MLGRPSCEHLLGFPNLIHCSSHVPSGFSRNIKRHTWMPEHPDKQTNEVTSSQLMAWRLAFSKEGDLNKTPTPCAHDRAHINDAQNLAADESHWLNEWKTPKSSWLASHLQVEAMAMSYFFAYLAKTLLIMPQSSILSAVTQDGNPGLNATVRKSQHPGAT